MKKIRLTRGYEALVDDDDFEMLNEFKWCACHDDFRIYARSSQREMGKTKTYSMHRVVLSAQLGSIVDHIDLNGLNNQKCNLRIVSTIQNTSNQNIRCNNKSGFKWVTWCRNEKKWKATIGCKYTKIFLGYFSKILDAAIAYDEAAVRINGEFARTNHSLGKY